MSNIRYLESMVDHYWPEMHSRFPAVEKPMIVPAKTLRGAAPMYMKRYIDQDENSFYMFLKANPLNGDASREMAKQFFDDFFYNKMRMPSSYDADSGMTPTRENPDFGRLSREDAIDKEVLPADNDRGYQEYYDEQMRKIQAEMSAEEKAEMEAKKKQERIDKLGFDPDDGNTIDVPSEDPAPSRNSSSRDIEVGTGTAVGMPKPIFYAVDFHIPAGGGMLGYGGGGRLGRRPAGRLRYGESEEDILSDEEVEFNESIMNKFRDYFN